MNKHEIRIPRRLFLKSSGAGIGMFVAGRVPGAEANGQEVELTDAHRKAVDRRRRISVQYDAYNSLGGDFQQWIDYRFRYADEPGSQIDGLWWDIGPTGAAEYSNPPANPGLRQWCDQGIDVPGRLIEETKKRNLECFWNHRISEVDLNPTGSGAAWKSAAHPFKQKHPDWVLKTWWPHGLWNLAVPDVRKYTLGVLHQLAEKYDLDGIQIDFARHVPCLPPGRQWELRQHVTDFMRSVRRMLLEVEKRRGRPFLLAAKVPRNLEGCRVDGFDVQQWARENLIDIFTLGSRSVEVDVAAYRRITAGRNIKLQPCFDDHHTADGYRYPPIEVFRGLFANWWQQGADSVATFNWSNAPPEVCKKIGCRPGPVSQQQAYRQIGSPKTLELKDKTFVVERRGGYPWAEGYFNRNDTSPLPAPLADSGAAATIRIRIADDFKQLAGKVKQVVLRAVLFGASDGDEFEIRLNGHVLAPAARDAQWKDPQIFSPRPQPASGGRGNYKINPAQKLVRLEYPIEPGACLVGENRVDARVVRRADARATVVLEKLEVDVRYQPGPTA